MDGLIKVDEVASMLQVSRWTVYRLIKEREIVSVKVGSSRRVPVQAVRDYIASLIEAA
jgi:excisionase family DNA binding protein